jgi:hypothetical protein
MEECFLKHRQKIDDQSERASVIRDDARELYKVLTEELQSLVYENVLYWNKSEAVTPDDVVEHFFREQRRIELRAELDRIQFG